jgi:hypothetical protein
MSMCDGIRLSQRVQARKHQSIKLEWVSDLKELTAMTARDEVRDMTRVRRSKTQVTWQFYIHQDQTITRRDLFLVECSLATCSFNAPSDVSSFTFSVTISLTFLSSRKPSDIIHALYLRLIPSIIPYFVFSTILLVDP